MRGLHELQLAEFALIELLLHEEILAGIDDGLHHHVAEAGFLHEFDDLFAIGDAGGHRHRAGDVLAGLQRLDAHPAVVRDGRVDVHGVHVRVFEQLFEVLVAHADAEGIAHGIELLLVALADGVAVRQRVTLPDGDEFRPETEADDGDVDLVGHGGRSFAKRGSSWEGQTLGEIRRRAHFALRSPDCGILDSQCLLPISTTTSRRSSSPPNRSLTARRRA